MLLLNTKKSIFFYIFNQFFIPSWSSVYLFGGSLLQSEQFFLVFLVVNIYQRLILSAFLQLKMS